MYFVFKVIYAISKYFYVFYLLLSLYTNTANQIFLSIERCEGIAMLKFQKVSQRKELQVNLNVFENIIGVYSILINVVYNELHLPYLPEYVYKCIELG